MSLSVRDPFLANILRVGHTSYPVLPTYYSLNIELKANGNSDAGDIMPMTELPGSRAAAAQMVLHARTAYNPPAPPEQPKPPPKEKEPEHPAIAGPPPRPEKPAAKKGRPLHKRSASYSGPPEPPHKAQEDEEPTPPPPPTAHKAVLKKKKVPLNKPAPQVKKKGHKRTQSVPEPTPMEAEKPHTPTRDRRKKIPLHKPVKKTRVKHRPPPIVAMDSEPTEDPTGSQHPSAIPVEDNGQVKNLTLGGSKRKRHPTKPNGSDRKGKNQSYTSQLNRLTRRLHTEMDGNNDPKKLAYLREAIKILQDLRLGNYKADLAKRGLEAPKDKPIPKGRTKKQQKIHKKTKRLRKVKNEIRLLKQAKKTAHGLNSDQIYDLSEAKANRYALRKALKRAGVKKKKK